MKTHQSGSVLAISLVLLTAITLIALMGLQRSGLQTKIVVNIQHKETVFNAALSEVDYIYFDLQRVNNQMLADAAEKPTGFLSVDTNILHPGLIKIDSRLEYQSNGNKMGLPNTSRLRNKTSRGKNGAGLENFKITSTAKTPSGIKSHQIVGLSFATPGL